MQLRVNRKLTICYSLDLTKPFFDPSIGMPSQLRGYGHRTMVLRVTALLSRDFLGPLARSPAAKSNALALKSSTTRSDAFVFIFLLEIEGYSYF